MKVSWFHVKIMAAAFLVAGPAIGAALIIGFDRDAFTAAVLGGETVTQDFELLPEGVLDAGAIAGLGIKASGGDVVVTDDYLASSGEQGLGSTSSKAAYPASTDPDFFLADEAVTFTFDEGITAFGLDINTLAEYEGAYSAVVTFADGTKATTKPFSVADPFPNRRTGGFIGFTSDTPVRSVKISGDQKNTYTVDRLVYGDAKKDPEPDPEEPVVAPVPLPAAMPLLALALGGLFLMRLRRSRG